MRGLATAAKTLRLYPPTSPIPRQAAESAIQALQAHLETEPVLALTVARDGFASQGVQLGAGIVGSADLAETLRAHGIAEVDITPGCTTDELLTFLSLLTKEPAETQAEGGLAAMLVAAGVESVRAADVALTVVDARVEMPEEDIDEFLRQLAADPDKLALWWASASKGDASTFAEGLLELNTAAGPIGAPQLLQALAEAFKSQDPSGKDAFLGVAMEHGEAQDLAGRVINLLGTGDMADALAAGQYGTNMLSLSCALTSLPLGSRMASILTGVEGLLPATGHTDKEREFLKHMVDVRSKPDEETALVDANTSYRAVADAVVLTEQDLEVARSAAVLPQAEAARRGVTTMLALLDQQSDFELYCKDLDALATVVPRLIEQGDLQTAHRVLDEITERQARPGQPWPELTAKLQETLAAMTGKRSMAALLRAVVADSSLVPLAHDVVQIAGESAEGALADEAIAAKAEGVAAAEQLLGRKLVNLLAARAPAAQWYQVSAIVERLSRETDSHAKDAIAALARRSDELSRREVAQGLAATPSPAAVGVLETLVRDESADVAIVAIRALAKIGGDAAVNALTTRLFELDLDGKDFAFAREIIGALARIPNPTSTEALKRLAARKTLIKRGHFAEVQELARQALNLHERRGGA